MLLASSEFQGWDCWLRAWSIFLCFPLANVKLRSLMGISRWKLSITHWHFCCVHVSPPFALLLFPGRAILLLCVCMLLQGQPCNCSKHSKLHHSSHISSGCFIWSLGMAYLTVPVMMGASTVNSYLTLPVTVTFPSIAQACTSFTQLFTN